MCQTKTDPIWKGFSPNTTPTTRLKKAKKVKDNTKQNKTRKKERAKSQKGNDSTSESFQKQRKLNAGTTGDKMWNESIHICQTGVSGVYLLVSRKSYYRKT